MGQITRSTFDFLNDLKENNHKTWFDANRERYEAALGEMINFADLVLEHMNTYDVLENEQGKKSLYRIYRDVRFSKDKSPYKSHWAGSFRRKGAERRGGYYFHITPGNTYLAGGFFSPNKEDLLLIRNHLAQDADLLREVLASNDFKTTFNQLTGEQVKTAPKNFDKNHPNIDLIRFKQFIIQHNFSDQEVLAADFEEKVALVFSKMLPFFGIMSEFLTTNLNGQNLI